jgi:hypothetical protein
MKKNPIYAVLLTVLMLTFTSAFPQSAIFLHHSTGSGVYSEGNVAGWIDTYNTDHGTGYSIAERSYPNSPYPWDNYPYDYWNLWLNNACDNENPDMACLDNLCANYQVIIFKHCFPGAGIEADDGNPSISSSKMTLANYKLQYRALRELMDSYTDNRFIVWTLTPLHRLATDAESAARARQFVDWVKNDWLTEDGKAHPNIAIFDFFGYIAESNPNPDNGAVNCLKYDYESSHSNSDSHPNTLANQTVGPLFAQFVVNTIENTPLIEVTGITVTGPGGSTTISTRGGTLQLAAEVLPVDASNKTVTWSIQNGTGQASVSETGLVTAIADGTVTVAATAADGSGISGNIVITLENQNLPTTLKEDETGTARIWVDHTEMVIRLNEDAAYQTIGLYSIMGNRVWDQKITGQQYSRNISSLSPGVYIIELTGKTGTRRLKVSIP